ARGRTRLLLRSAGGRRLSSLTGRGPGRSSTGLFLACSEGVHPAANSVGDLIDDPIDVIGLGHAVGCNPGWGPSGSTRTRSLGACRVPHRGWQALESPRDVLFTAA